MIDLNTTLSNFIPISLEEMVHVTLLDRIDTKFIIHESQLLGYLKSIEKDYSILDINGNRKHPYETLYFDTPDFQLYQMHHNGILNRYKLRCRQYVNSGISFFEVKSKTNTSRTIKNRIQLECFPEKITELMTQYINEYTPGINQNYIPSLSVYFDRITLVNRTANERLTFDINLRYRRNGDEKKIQKIVIVEVKQEKYTKSPFRELMKIQRQPENYLSKYCMGLMCLQKNIKTNNFKHKLIELNKLGYDIY